MRIKKAVLEQIKGTSFAGKSDTNHWITMDNSAEFGGNSAGSSPKELILLGLAGCTATDVITILKKKRVDINDFKINVTAEVAEEHPKVFTKIHLEYLFFGENIPSKDVERAIELSRTKYCSITKMLEKTVEITHSFKIIDRENILEEKES